MARTLTAGVITELTASNNRPMLLVEIELASTYLRLWTGYGDLSWNGFTWSGNGYLHNISGNRETDSLEAPRLDIVLAGVPSDLISIALSQIRQNKSGKLYLGFLNSSGAVIADPYLAFTGKLDEAFIVEDPANPQITLSYESILVDLDKASEGRYTEEFQNRFNGAITDWGFGFVLASSEWSGYWGTGKKKPEQKKKNKGKTNRNKNK